MVVALCVGIFLIVSGCSGRFVCEYESQDERFEKLIEKTLEKADGSDERAEVGAVQDFPSARGIEAQAPEGKYVGNRGNYCYAEGADSSVGEVRWRSL